MQKTQIKVGKWYHTTQGIGLCLKTGGCHPWAAEVHIVGPIPRGRRLLVPREFQHEDTVIPGQLERALRRFPTMDPIVSTTPPSQDIDMMAACDIGHYVVGYPLAGCTKWRWSLTVEGRDAWGKLPKEGASETTEPHHEPLTRHTELREQNHWHAMYLGAFTALVIPNVEMAYDLAKITRSDEECVAAIRILRTSKEGDRVWPALEHLRVLREGEKATAPS